MKVFKILCGVIIIFCFCQQSIMAQWRTITNDTYYTPVVSFVNSLYPEIPPFLLGLAQGISQDRDSYYIERAWIPFFMNKYRLQSIKTPNGKAKLKWWDWGLKNYSIGYNVFYVPKLKHIGLNFSLNYERSVITCMLPNETEYRDYRKNMIVPKIALVFRIGDAFDLSKIKFFLKLGCSYDYTFAFKGKYNDKKSVNNGFAGILSFSCQGLSGGAYEASFWQIFERMSINYEHKFYNYFNSKFSPDGTSYPYKDYKSNFGFLYLSTTVIL